MPEIFIPLLPSCPAPSDSLVPLRAGLPAPVVTRPAPVLAAAFPAEPTVTAAPSTHSHAPAPAGAAPKITLVREGDCVKQIRVECSCGQVVQLDCTY